MINDDAQFLQTKHEVLTIRHHIMHVKQQESFFIKYIHDLFDFLYFHATSVLREFVYKKFPKIHKYRDELIYETLIYEYSLISQIFWEFEDEIQTAADTILSDEENQEVKEGKIEFEDFIDLYQVEFLDFLRTHHRRALNAFISNKLSVEIDEKVDKFIQKEILPELLKNREKLTHLISQLKNNEEEILDFIILEHLDELKIQNKALFPT